VDFQMKNIYFLLVFVILFGFVWHNTTKAECPDGWFERQVVVDNFPACNNIVAKVCVQCDITAPFMSFKITEIIGTESCTGFYLESFIDFLCARLTANYFEFCPGGYQPCAEGRRDIYVYIPLCFYENDQQPYDFLYCQTSWCIEHWWVCTREDGTVEVIKDEREWVLTGDPNPVCLSNVYREDLPPGTCFHVRTQCTE
jgi:hypothetical protein